MRPWLEGYPLLLRWRLAQLRTVLPLLLALQTLLSVGVVYGLALLVPDLDATAALYLSTGAPALSLLLVGLTMVPQEVIMSRSSGGFDYMRCFPVPRLAHLAAEMTVWLAVQLPATALALGVAAVRFHFALHVSPLVVPVMLLVGLTSAAIGYALALGLPIPLAQPMTSFLSIVLLLFSPINFPASRLPTVLQAIHHVLPIGAMADLLRWTLTGVHDESLGLGTVLVVTWSLVALAICHRVATARH